MFGPGGSTIGAMIGVGGEIRVTTAFTAPFSPCFGKLLCIFVVEIESGSHGLGNPGETKKLGS